MWDAQICDRFDNYISEAFRNYRLEPFWGRSIGWKVLGTRTRKHVVNYNFETPSEPYFRVICGGWIQMFILEAYCQLQLGSEAGLTIMTFCKHVGIIKWNPNRTYSVATVR